MTPLIRVNTEKSYVEEESHLAGSRNHLIPDNGSLVSVTKISQAQSIPGKGRRSHRRDSVQITDKLVHQVAQLQLDSEGSNSNYLASKRVLKGTSFERKKHFLPMPVLPIPDVSNEIVREQPWTTSRVRKIQRERSERPYYKSPVENTKTPHISLNTSALIQARSEFDLHRKTALDVAFFLPTPLQKVSYDRNLHQKKIKIQSHADLLKYLIEKSPIVWNGLIFSLEALFNAQEVFNYFLKECQMGLDHLVVQQKMVKDREATKKFEESVESNSLMASEEIGLVLNESSFLGNQWNQELGALFTTVLSFSLHWISFNIGSKQYREVGDCLQRLIALFDPILDVEIQNLVKAISKAMEAKPAQKKGESQLPSASICSSDKENTRSFHPPFIKNLLEFESQSVNPIKWEEQLHSIQKGLISEKDLKEYSQRVGGDLFYMQRSLVSAIPSSELFPKKWDGASPGIHKETYIKIYNHQTFFVVNAILSCSEVEERGNVVAFFLLVAADALKRQDYASVFALVAAMNHCAISRLKKTWEIVSKKSKMQKLKKNIELVCDPHKNYKAVRACMDNHVVDQKSYIPLMSLILKDFFILFETVTQKTDEAYNMDLWVHLIKQVRRFDLVKSMLFSPSPYFSTGIVKEIVKRYQNDLGDDERQQDLFLELSKKVE